MGSFMKKKANTLFVFFIFFLILSQSFLFVNGKVNRIDSGDLAAFFDPASHAEENKSLLSSDYQQPTSDSTASNDPAKSGTENLQDPLWEKEASVSSLFPDLYEIPGVLKVNPLYEYITDYKIKDENTALVVTDKSIYLKLNGKIVSVSTDGIPSNAFFSSCELARIDDKIIIFVGTSYSGLFGKVLDAKKFSRFYNGVKRVFYTSSYSMLFETISSLFFFNDRLFIGYQSSKGIDILDVNSFLSSLKTKNSYKIIETKIILRDSIKEEIEKFFELNSTIYAYSNYGIYRYEENENRFVLEKEFDNIQTPDDNNIRGLYVSSFAASSKKKIDELVDIATYCGLNAFVVDFKDDFGYLSWGSKLPLALKMKSSRNLIQTQYLFEQANKHNIKIIARFVCFRDPVAYNYDNSRFALWSKSANAPWKGATKMEAWIDPYNLEYQQYLIDAAIELQNLGVSEIQFDYVRFPAEGNISDVYYRYNKDNISKNVLIYSFFKNAKASLKIPVGADFFGYQCWYKISRHIGQDIFLDSQVLDAIYPMYYPSHFSDGFYEKGLGQPDTVRLIYQHGTIRAMENSNYNISIRPWIQAFNLKVKIDMVSYIINEIKGVKEAGINSYIFWNPSCKYSFLYEVFRDKSLKF